MDPLHPPPLTTALVDTATQRLTQVNLHAYVKEVVEHEAVRNEPMAASLQARGKCPDSRAAAQDCALNEYRPQQVVACKPVPLPAPQDVPRNDI